MNLQLSGLIVRPGDILLVCSLRPLTMADTAELKDEVMAMLPGLAGVAVLENVAALAVYRPDPAADDAA
jgi:hypothetical protein